MVAFSESLFIKSLSFTALNDFNWLRNSTDSRRLDLPTPLEPRSSNFFSLISRS